MLNFLMLIHHLFVMKSQESVVCCGAQTSSVGLYSKALNLLRSLCWFTC